MFLFVLGALALAHVAAGAQQCAVFCDPAITSPPSPCGETAATACPTIKACVDAVNALPAASLGGCLNVTMNIKQGATFTGKDNVGIDIQFAVADATLPIRVQGAIGGPATRPKIDGEEAELGDHALWKVHLLEKQKVRLYGLDFQNGVRSTAGGYGGGMEVVAQSSDSTIELDSVAFINNFAPNGGGFAMRDRGTVIMKFSEFDNNTASVEAVVRVSDDRCIEGGGGALLVGSDLHIELDGVYFSGNEALLACGGGLLIADAPNPLAENLNVVENSAKDGGGIMADEIHTTDHWDDCRFEANAAMEGGGGAFFARSTIVMTNADVISNTANRGAGFFVEQSALTIDQSKFDLNIAEKYGGGLFVHGINPTMTGNSNLVKNSTFEINEIQLTGGLGTSLYCADANVTFAPTLPTTDSWCDTDCMTPQETCACAECQMPDPNSTPSTSTPSPSGDKPHGPSNPWPVLAPLLIIFILGVVGVAFYLFRKHSSSSRAKFLNI